MSSADRSLGAISAVIFDLDGLVLDSETTYFRAWRQAAVDMGHALDEAFCASLSGLQGGEVYRLLQRQLGESFDLSRFQDISRQHWISQVRQDGIPVKTGFFALLQVIERLGWPYALATNSRRLDAEFCLDCAGLSQQFPVIVTRDDVRQGKPAPDIFLRVAEALAQPVQRCLILEDSPIGVAAAFAAGAPCVFVPSQRPADDVATAQAAFCLDDLQRVADFISAQWPLPL